MRPQKVSVDVWKMVIQSLGYLGLAFMAWVLLKLVYACFRLPSYLRENEEFLDISNEAETISNNTEDEKDAQTKKTE